MKRQNVWLALVILLVVGFSVKWWVSAEDATPHSTPHTSATPAPTGAAPLPMAETVPTPAKASEPVARSRTFPAFTKWMQNAAATPPSPDEIQQGISLAQARQGQMRGLIRANPASALANAVSLREYASLPDAIKPYVEKPFSERADIMVLPDDSGLNPQSKSRFDPNKRVVGEETYLTLQNEKSLELVRYGDRASILSKEGLPLKALLWMGLPSFNRLHCNW